MTNVFCDLFETNFCPAGISHSSWEVKFACKASMIAQVKWAEHLPATKHVALCNLLEGPWILVVLFHFRLLLVHRLEALSAQYLRFHQDQQ